MKQTVFGIFDKQSDAQNAVKRLVDDGFSHGLIDVHSTRSDNANKRDNAHHDDNDGIGGFFSNYLGIIKKRREPTPMLPDEAP